MLLRSVSGPYSHTFSLLSPKANCNRLLDVARETYKENVGDIYTLCSTLSEEHGLPLTLVYQETGFVFSLKKSDAESGLPRGFINPSIKKGKWYFSSLDLVRHTF
jgi:DNA mismatch repair protein MSH4